MGAALRCTALFALAIVVAVAALGGAPRALAQTAPAVQSEPARDAILTSPPRRIDLAFMEVVDPSGPATIRLVGSDGRTMQVGALQFDPHDPRHIAATIPEALPAGTYTVLWSATFAPPATGSAATPRPDANG
ncbi:MAG TPA: copper resistance protein CopC, partial [Thermomicrobiales bacterium]|nr:copper resistance protein CopC [Thermomicrobiales bacterium]